MLSRRDIFDIYRLHDEGISLRDISKRLQINRRTIRKYLSNPDLKPNKYRKRKSKLDLYKPQIRELLNKDPGISSMVIMQRITELGFQGGITIIKDYLKTIRDRKLKAYIRFESMPGQQFQIDWGYFDSINYGNAKRKLYCFAIIESHSRMLYLEFTHSMKMEAFLRCHYNAFVFFGGTCRDIVHDNLKSAVIERIGKLIRFNERYLEFLMHFHINPIACTPRSPWQKGKIEKGGIHYIRNNFWPARTFKDLSDVNAQACEWRDNIANVRIHGTTNERPAERFKPDKLKPLPTDYSPDLRDQFPTKVHRDINVNFDANYYSVPHWAVGKSVIVKADNNIVSVYLKSKIIATHQRSWDKKKYIENPKHIEKLLKTRKRALLSKQEEIFFSLGDLAEDYLKSLIRTGKPLQRSITGLLELKDKYGVDALLQSLKIAVQYGAYGLEYIKNILYQQQHPKIDHPKLILNNPALNQLYLHDVSLKEYDNLIFDAQKEKNHEFND